MDFISKQAKIAYQQLKQLARNTAIGAVIILGIAAMLTPEPSLLLKVLPNIAYAFFASLVVGVAAGIAKTFFSSVGGKLGRTIGKDIGKKLVALVRSFFYAREPETTITVQTAANNPVITATRSDPQATVDHGGPPLHITTTNAIPYVKATRRGPKTT